MPMFQYKAVSSAGEVKEGVLEGATLDIVIAHLQSTGLIPIRAAEVSADGRPVNYVVGAIIVGIWILAAALFITWAVNAVSHH